MGSRKTRQVETRMLAEYLKERYSKFPRIIKQPLGTVDEYIMAKEGYERALGLTRAFRPEIDAIVLLPRYFLLIEAKVWRIVDGLAKLPLYASLVPSTPELKRYQPRGIIMQLVVGWTNPNLEVMAKEAGVELKLYCPDWLKEVEDKMHNYWTKEYREARESRLRMREFYGVE